MNRPLALPPRADLALLIVAMLLSTASPAATAPIQSASEYEYPPFSIVTRDGRADGFAVELLRVALGAMGQEVRFRIGPWHEIKQALAEGRIQVLPLVARTPELDAVFDFTAPYLSMHGAIVVRKGDARFRQVADLRGASVVVMRGDIAEEYAQTHRLSDRIVTTETLEEGLRQLSAGQHDAMVVQKLAAEHLIRTLGLTDLAVVGPLLTHYQDFCFAVREGDKALLATLNEGLALVIADGSLERLREKWIAPTLDERITYTLQFAAVALATLLLAGLAYLWQRALRAQVKARTQALQESEKRLRLAAGVFVHAREAIMITDAKATILDVNDAFTQITGYSRADVLGRNPRLLKSGRQGDEFYADLWNDLIKNELWGGEVWNRRKDGTLYAEHLTISAVHDAQGQPQNFVAIFTDITQQKEYQRCLEHSAHHDALTQLPNRTLLADRLQQAMVQAARRGHHLTVALLDLDGFKEINDTHGHAAGDQLLIAVADRMKRAVREVDTIARLGGDEFVVVLTDLTDTQASLPMLKRLLIAIAQPMQTGGLVLQVSASLGLTFYPQAADVDADQLLRQADQAMYHAKLAGKNRYHIFDAEQERCVRAFHEGLDRIRQALTRREFVLYYQPKANMRTGHVVGVEALIRWQHPERGLLAPDVFLTLIESHPLAIELGEWVIGAALEQITAWRNAGLSIPVSVNIGALHLQQTDFMARLRKILATHPEVKPSDLMLEVLETSAMANIDRVSEVMRDCREIRVIFALDNFGAGFSSLTYLKRLSADQIKIDKRFVRDVLDDPDDLAILEGVLGLATALRSQVVAAGVETERHGDMLLQIGCDLAQGYGIASPMPAAELPAWIDTWRPNATWMAQPVTSCDDLPLLFAGVVHRAWIREIEEVLRGKHTILKPLDHHQCRFGQWMEGAGKVRYGAHPAFQDIEQLHLRVHGLGAELLALQIQGRTPQALARLDEFFSLREGVLQQLKALAQNGGATAESGSAKINLAIRPSEV